MTSDLTVSEQDSASFGPRDMKVPGDTAWCWQTVSFLQTMWKALDIDLDIYLRTWAEAEEHKVWEKIPYENPYGTKEAMLADLELGDDARARARVASDAVTAIPLRPNGAAKKSSAERMTARIARDRPDIWERMKLGEFTSVAAAAREAGIYQNKPRAKKVTVNDDVEKLAKSIREILGTEDFGRFVDFALGLSTDNPEAGNC